MVLPTFQPGEMVEWLFTPRGGYGYSYWVPCTVVKVSKKTITIDAKLTNGGTKRVHAKPERIRYPFSSYANQTMNSY